MQLLKVRSGRRRRLLPMVMLGLALPLLMPAGGALAASSVQWLSPANNSTFTVGTAVNPTGQVTRGTVAGGLDLAIVLDASGSMGGNVSAGGVTKSALRWQADAAVALVNSLPTNSTSVAIVQFANSATLRLALTPTTQASTIVAAINAVGASGLTATGPGIQRAQTELLGSGATAGRSKQMVVISDGGSNSGISPVTAAANARSAGITVHGVVIPGGNATEMNSIANAGGGAFADFRDPANLANIEAFFSTGGGFVGLDQLDLTLPNGSLLTDYLTDAFGNFRLDPAWALTLGRNLFVAMAHFNDGTTASAELSLFGVTPGQAPVPATGLLLLLGSALLGVMRRRQRAMRTPETLVA